MERLDEDGRRGQSTGTVLATAGAVPVKTKDGKLSMQKVKVQRYIAGKRPEFDDSDSGREASSGGESDDERGHRQHPQSSKSRHRVEEQASRESGARDSRLKRLQRFKEGRDADNDEDRSERHRRIHEPEVISSSSSRREPEPETERPQLPLSSRITHRAEVEESASDQSEDEDASDEEIERRRDYLRKRQQLRIKQEEELLARQQEENEAGKEESDDDDSSEYEEYTDSEDDGAPRLKPVFVRKKDRVTLQETEKETQRMTELQLEAKRAAEERKRDSVKLVENMVRRELEMENREKEDNLDLTSVLTDDENEELAYECWKIRELKRIKRTKDEREAMAREKAEWERVHNMTEEERRQYQRLNPKVVTNKAEKGRYKFLQKYYHRGVFFLDDEDEVYKRNFAEATLEDQFDKSVLPKVMQVKDFGKQGRTKWTHLVAEDTTDFQAPWVADAATSIKFHNKHGGGVKDVFERPAAKKKKV